MKIVFFLASLILQRLVRGTHNTTVDDSNPSISYEGDWEPDSSLQSSLDYNGSHTLSSDPTARATFNFTGVSIYYWSPRWPYAVNSMLTLDSGPGVTVNLTDTSRPSTNGGQETVQSSPVWSATNLTNAQHQIVVSMAPNGPYVVVDAFTYTADETNISTSTSVSSSSSSSFSQLLSNDDGPTMSATGTNPTLSTVAQDNNNSHKTSTARTVAIAAGSAGGALVLLCTFAAGIIFSRRLRSRRLGSGNNIYSDMIPFPPGEAAPVTAGYHTPLVRDPPSPPMASATSSVPVAAASYLHDARAAGTYNPWPIQNLERHATNAYSTNLLSPSQAMYYGASHSDVPSSSGDTSYEPAVVEKQHREWERSYNSSVDSFISSFDHGHLPAALVAGPSNAYTRMPRVPQVSFTDSDGNPSVMSVDGYDPSTRYAPSQVAYTHG